MFSDNTSGMLHFFNTPIYLMTASIFESLFFLSDGSEVGPSDDQLGGAAPINSTTSQEHKCSPKTRH